MRMAASPWRRYSARLAAGLVGPVLLSSGGLAWADGTPAGPVMMPGVQPVVLQDAPEPLPTPPAASTNNTPLPEQAAVPAYTLADLIRLACDHQPNIAAARASLAAAQTGSRGLQQIRVPTFIARDLPLRRQQAQLGIQAASADLATAERETAYAVTRMYFTVQFARAQQKVAQRVVNELQESLNNAKLLLGKPGAPRDLTQNAVDRNSAFLGLARTRLVAAEEGEKRALAALREAVGLGPECSFTVPAEAIPTPPVKPTCKEIVALALQCRGEIVETSVLAQATALEAEAQSKSCRMRRATFASYVDLHAHAVPTTVSDDEYRPGALAPALPTALAGSRAIRVELAQEYTARADAVATKTRDLVALEAENAFLRWLEASRNLPEAENAYKVAQKTSTTTLNDFKSGLNVPYRDVLESVVIGAQIGAQLNEIRYHYAIELAALERVTGGGFCAGLVPVVDSVAPTATGPNMIGD